MSKQPPDELAAEQRAEIVRWMAAIDAAHTTAIFKADYATIAHLHKAVARLMGNYQRFRKQQAALQGAMIQHMIDEAKKEEAGE